MSLDANDPRITAYALGQLNEAERAEFEALLDADTEGAAEARRAVEETRRVAEAVRRALGQEPVPGRSPELRQEVQRRLAAEEATEETTEATAEETAAEADGKPAASPPAPAAAASGKKASSTATSAAAGDAPRRASRRRLWLPLATAAALLVALGLAAFYTPQGRRMTAYLTRDDAQYSAQSPAATNADVDWDEKATARPDDQAMPFDPWSQEMPRLGNGARQAALEPDVSVIEPTPQSPAGPGFVGGSTRTSPISDDDDGTGGQGFGGLGGGGGFGDAANAFGGRATGRPEGQAPGEVPFRSATNFGSVIDGLSNTATIGEKHMVPAWAGGQPGTPPTGPPAQNDDLGDDGESAQQGQGGRSHAPGRDAGRDEQSGKSSGDQEGEGKGKRGDNGDPQKQPRTWRRNLQVPNTSRLMIGEREELPLQGMQANVHVDGFRARVLLDLYFYNDRNQRYEGTFNIRLPNESSLYFFAFGETVYESEQPQTPPKGPIFFSVERSRQLGNAPKQIMLARQDTWRDPKEARMVPREKAAYAYRETVRRKVDPALVEWAGGGVFTARVFPLAPQKLHRIVIGYDVNLQEVGDDLVYRMDLPEQLPQCVVDLQLASLGRDQVEVKPSARPHNENGRVSYRWGIPEKHTIEVRVKKPGGVLLKGHDDETGDYFAARFKPQLPEAEESTAPRDGVFLVDTSLSANPDRFNVYLKLLKATLNNNRDTLKRFNVLLFNVESHWWRQKMVANTAENVEAALDYAHSLALEGATDLLQAAREATAPKWLADDAKPDWDYFLLSDAFLTWGDRDPVRIAEQIKTTSGALFAYSTGLSGDDTRMMAYLARETGGGAFPVVGEDQIEKVSRAHRSRPWQLARVEIDGGSDLVLAGRPQTVFPGQTLLLVGRGTPADDAEVTLTLFRAGEDKVVHTKLSEAVHSDLAARVYGEVTTNALEDYQQATEDVAVAYARHFRVTGRTCSLLMLESEAAYQRFNIKPEEDAFMVKSSPAAATIEGAIDKLAGQRNDPKAAFSAWLDRLQRMPGATVNVSPALRKAVEMLPASAFDVTPKPMECKLRSWQDLPGAFQDEQLTLRPLSYDAVTAEAARRFTAGGNGDDALKALSSLVELNPGDGVLARDVGFSAIEWGRPDQAYALLHRVALARPYEPQTYHAMARSLAEMGNTDLAILYYDLAVTGNWDNRFGEFNRIAGLDYLRLLRQIESGQRKSQLADFAKARLATIDNQYGVGEPDLVVTMAWNTDGTDVDMHVIEPSGEECFYQHRDTRLGGHLTTDVTQGYGPEMYVLRKAVNGKYAIKAHYYSTDTNRASTRTRVHVTVYQFWGTPEERVTHKTVTLDTGKQLHDVETVIIK